jgi:undecaprenyl-diphosphatase
MPNVDYRISHYFATLNGQVPAFDRFMWMLSSNSLLKGGVLAAFLWYAWFAELGRSDRVRARATDDRLVIIRLLVSCAAAEMLSRLLSACLPFRPRPLLNASLPFILPKGITIESLNIATESSFPSDHGVLFFAMCAGIWLVSRRAAWLSLIWVTLIVIFPRLYLGLHYASDLLAGAVIGTSVAIIGARAVPRSALLKTVVLRSRTHPALFYPLFFLALHQVANMLIDLRNLGSAIKAMG